MKPIHLKAGVPLALTAAGLIFTMISRRKTKPLAKTSGSQSQLGSDDATQEGLNSLQNWVNGNSDVDAGLMMGTQEFDDRTNLEEEISSLKRQVNDLRSWEEEIEAWLLHYCFKREQESSVNELRSRLELENAHVRFLGLKIESCEIENRRLEAILDEYPKVVEQLESAKSEIRLLRRRMKRSFRMNKQGWSLLREQASVLRARELEILSNNEEMKRMGNRIKELEDAVIELTANMDQLRKEKDELMESVELGKRLNLSTSEDPGEEKTMDDPERLEFATDDLPTQLQHLRDGRINEVEELVYLRWINACLRHELMRNQDMRPSGQEPKEEQQEEQLATELAGNDETVHLDPGYDSEGSLALENGGTGLDVAVTRHSSPTKPVLFNKLKRWVKGKEKFRRSSDEYKCPGRWCASEGDLEDLRARKSCSSVKPSCGRISIS